MSTADSEYIVCLPGAVAVRYRQHRRRCHQQPT
jgi:hypothetical protein